MLHPLDPNGLVFAQPNRIWLDVARNLCCVVSDEDYAWALQWMWVATPNSTGKLFYATRMTSRGERRNVKLYMHKEILLRSGKQPTHFNQVLGDHEDRNTLNNRRYNLRWFSHVQNSRNRATPRRSTASALLQQSSEAV